jgi:predicted transcriptional regulator
METDLKLTTFQTDPEDRRMLLELAKAQDRSMSAVLRQLIKEAYLKLSKREAKS